ncbi:MAG: ABC transporter permease subunit [Pseudomonadota bacterium]
MILTVAAREFRNLFALPSTWLILGVLQFIFAWFFLARLDAFLQMQAQLAQIGNAPGATQAVAAPLFDTVALILMMLVPIFTMRLLAEERRNQTLTLLLSAPVSSMHIVLGKFFSLLLFLLLIIISCVSMVLVLNTGTKLDNGLVFSNALGLLLLAASYAALGLYISSLTTQPAVAAVAALAALFALWLADISAADGNYAWRWLSPTSHFQSFNNGLLNSADAVYFLAFSIVFVLLAARRIHNNRVYG